MWNILSDGSFELLVANAAHIKKSRRKTDVNDATGSADLMACGLIRGSFVRTRHSRNCGPCCGPASD